MKIYIGSDHAGFYLKEALKPYLEYFKHEVVDMGATAYNPDDDFADFIFPVARAVADGGADRGIIIGSSGEGEAIAANRIHGVRAFVYYASATPLPETAKVGEPKDIVTISREDNDSNILSLGASFIAEEEAKEVVRRWLETPFTGEERHVRRIKKLDNFHEQE